MCTHLDEFVGSRFVYTYDNGWQYEMYVKNAGTIDYRIHSGLVGGRWVKDQPVDLVQLTDGVWKVSWAEPTGTAVSVTVVPAQRRLHGVIFFPRWVADHPERTVLFQNDHLEEMAAFRDVGPTYPLEVIPEFAEITWLDHPGPDDDTVIDCGPGDLPDGWADRRN